MAGTYFYDSWLAEKNPIDYVKDKKKSAKSYMNYMIIRLQKMLKYTSLPESIPRESLENYLIVNGSCFSHTNSCINKPIVLPFYAAKRLD